MLLLDEKQIMEKSLAAKIKLTFKEFVNFNDIDLNTIMVDKIFHNISNDMPIYMDDHMVEYLGYNGKMKDQRTCVKLLIVKNFSDYQNKLWYSYKNKEYIEFCENIDENLEIDQSISKNTDEKIEKSSIYPPAPTGRGTSTTKHLLVMPKIFKEMLMLAQTDKGKQVRRYYIDMMEVMEIYIKFQNQVQTNTLTSELECTNSKLDDIKLILIESKKNQEESEKKREESEKKRAESEKKRAESENKRAESEKRQEESEKKRAESENKRAESEKRQEESEKRFEYESKKRAEEFNKLMGITKETKSTLDKVLPHSVDIELSDPDYPQVFILRDLDAEEGEHNFYAMRCQTSNYKTRLRELKSKYGDNIKRACTIKQPNAVIFWKSVKKELRNNLVCDSTSNWFSLKDMTKIQFKKKITEINTKRLTKTS
jgi:hypothetical protein